jgi:pimeloyl-ACP methyl ester carboxylesterase
VTPEPFPDLLGRLSDLLLTSRALGPVTVTREALVASLREAAGARGTLEEIAHDGDPREPARLVALFASRGEPATRPTILFLHGKGGAASEWRRDAARAVRLGWNALVPDLRGHAPSGGARLTYGFFEEVDLALLLDAAAERFGIDPSRVGIDACSMGTLPALRLAASRPVAALWLQSPFGDLHAMATRYVHRATGVPEALLALPLRAALALLERRTGLPLSAIDPIAPARRVTAPAYVVQGLEDALVPHELPRAVHAALAGEKELWPVPRCGHCHHPDEPQAIRSAEYLRRWGGFFRRHLPPPPRRLGSRA